MECEKVLVELDAYRRGELPPDVRSQIKAHLTSCSACAEEAVAMERTGDLLKQGLHEWVDAGECPPELARQIELQIRHAVHKRPWWQHWQLPVGAVAVAAVIFLVLVATQPEVASHMASVPILGSFAAQFVAPGLEYHVDASAPDRLASNAKTYQLNATGSSGGVALTVHRLEIDANQTQIEYTLSGVPFDTAVVPASYQPTLTTAVGAVALHGFKATQRKDEIDFTATFAAVKPDEVLTLAISQFPQVVEQAVVWAVPATVSGRVAATPDAFGANLISWVPQGAKVLAALEWPEGKLLHLTDFTAVDAAGKTHAVTENGAVVGKNGKITQLLYVDMNGSNGPVTLTARKTVQAASGSVSVSFTPAGH